MSSENNTETSTVKADMFGTNPIRPPEKGDGQILQVQSIFATLQGEGPYAGTPAVFIRLGGCNLACDFCDTEFESFQAMGCDEIAALTVEKSFNDENKSVIQLIVITGGEPLRQNIAPLCDQLQQEGFKVQVETNGTLFRPLPEGVELVCSPKNTTGKYGQIREDILQRSIAVKFILSKYHANYQQVANVGQEKYSVPVYVQPMDEKDPERNRANTSFAAEMASRYGYHLSLQLHKLLGIE